MDEPPRDKFFSLVIYDMLYSLVKEIRLVSLGYMKKIIYSLRHIHSPKILIRI